MSSSAGLLRGATGRLRLPWRLGLFALVAASVAIVVGFALPGGLTSGAAALLVGGLCAGAWLLSLDGRGPGALGFHLSREAAPESVGGIVLGSGIGLAVVVIMAALGVVSWAPMPGRGIGWIAGALGAMAYLALPAAAEEALLRGYPLQALAEVWGRAPALVGTSVVFGLLHLGNPGATVLATVNIVAAGLLLGVVYLKTASLWWATGVHLGWNWSHGYVADVPVSGLEVVDAPLYDGFTTGPGWLGGGAFGPEGSVIATAVVLLATAVLWWGPWPRAGEAARAADPLVAPFDDERGSSADTAP